MNFEINKNLYLFRHGLATHSKTGYGNRIVTAQVLPEGINAVKKLAQYLNNVQKSINISSEFIRCRQTAAIITDITQKEFQFDKRLNERYQEEFDDFTDRVKSFLHDLNKFNEQNIIICTHGIVIAAIKNLILNNMFELENQYDYPLTGELVIIKGKTFEKTDFND